MRWLKRENLSDSKYDWHYWFAWYPVQVKSQMVWFEWVQRKHCYRVHAPCFWLDSGVDLWTEYREK